MQNIEKELSRLTPSLESIIKFIKVETIMNKLTDDEVMNIVAILYIHHYKIIHDLSEIDKVNVHLNLNVLLNNIQYFEESGQMK